MVPPEILIIASALLVLLIGIQIVLRVRHYFKLPHRCPSCGGRFDETKVRRFCQVGDKSVYFCEKCTSYPRERLEANNLAFAAKGFSAEELNMLKAHIIDYKHLPS